MWRYKGVKGERKVATVITANEWFLECFQRANLIDLRKWSDLDLPCSRWTTRTQNNIKLCWPQLIYEDHWGVNQCRPWSISGNLSEKEWEPKGPNHIHSSKSLYEKQPTLERANVFCYSRENWEARPFFESILTPEPQPGPEWLVSNMDTTHKLELMRAYTKHDSKCLDSLT